MQLLEDTRVYAEVLLFSKRRMDPQRKAASGWPWQKQRVDVMQPKSSGPLEIFHLHHLLHTKGSLASMFPSSPDRELPDRCSGCFELVEERQEQGSSMTNTMHEAELELLK
jgi:hypothetical protein